MFLRLSLSFPCVLHRVSSDFPRVVVRFSFCYPLVSLWMSFGVVCEFSVILGVILVSFWWSSGGHFGVILVSFWCIFGVSKRILF